ncbi:MAG: imidazole glycerol phosphate synthase subunit HisF [Candidatus Omnitrophica bacterium]|nr:imidazole glycerol phosphate synthase subunit HisF [Candidatus Omnitrophota bacterium]MCM8826823.1 imidazole glycerol phosphate synthase subunit HisF [Candidatus Omnitrophota bacterium]
MLAKRIIPCLDIDEGRVVKGVNFVNLKDAGDPVENALTYDKEGADELVFLDITASYQQRNITIDVVKKVSEVIFMPFTVGGGIRTIDDIRSLLLAGADKVSLNTIAVKNPAIVKKASRIFGSQCIVVAIDAKACKFDLNSKKPIKWEVYINGGRTPTGIDAVKWAEKVESLGAGEILLTSMDYDGTKKGYDIALTKEISQKVGIPVIASGGAGKLSHFFEVFSETKATAALAASVFHYRKFSIRQVKNYLRKKGVEVRI